MVYDRSSSKNIYLNVAVNTLKKLRSKSTPTSPVISASNTNTQINTPVIMSFLLSIYLLISRCSSEVTEGTLALGLRAFLKRITIVYLFCH